MVKGIGKKFMHDTQYKHMENSDQSRGLPHPPRAALRSRRQIIALPRPEALPGAVRSTCAAHRGAPYSPRLRGGTR